MRVDRTLHSDIAWLAIRGDQHGDEPGMHIASPGPSLYIRASGSCNQPLTSNFSETMLNEVYNRRILELAAAIPRLGRLGRPDATATAHSKLCGSTVTVDLKMDGDVISDFAHEVKACALGQASSSIMARNVVGSHAAVVRAPRIAGRGLIKAYHYTLSPLLGWNCRHLPTCSEYAEEAIGRFGLWAGGWMAAARLARCHPLGTSGLDLVPGALAGDARW